MTKNINEIRELSEMIYELESDHDYDSSVIDHPEYQRVRGSIMSQLDSGSYEYDDIYADIQYLDSFFQEDSK